MSEFIRSQNIEMIAKQRNVFIAISIISVICSLLLSIRLVTLDDRIILVPSLNQEVWTSKDGVSSSYLEETTTMYLPLLLDLDSDSIDWKRQHLMSHISQSDPKYIKALTEYFARIKEQYKQFSLSTHFAPKNIETNPKKLIVKVSGQLISRFGERGFESNPASYGLSYEWLGGKLLLKEFVKLENEDK